MNNIVVNKHQQLLEQGFCKFENILDEPMLDELRRVTDELLAQQTPEEKERFRYQGSNISIVAQHAVFPRLFTWPKTLAALRELGYERPKWMSGFLLSKPPHAPPLYWHQDWAAWDDPISGEAEPTQLFLMYYLHDTSRENGCLRVIPGTHRKRIPFHDELPLPHTDASNYAMLDSPLFRTHPDEVDVPVQAGDLLIGDARLLHAAHPNKTNERRTLLTLWYMPKFDELPDSIKATFSRPESLQPEEWGDVETGRAMQSLLASYSGNAQPVKGNRRPGEYLKRCSAQAS